MRVIAKNIISGRRRTRFVERKKAKIAAGLNCKTLQSYMEWLFEIADENGLR